MKGEGKPEKLSYDANEYVAQCRIIAEEASENSGLISGTLGAYR